MKFLSLVSDLESTSDAARQLAERAKAIEPDVVFIFFSAAHAENAQELVEQFSGALGGAAIVGCSAEGVIGGEVEIEREPGIAILAAKLPDVRIHPFHIARDEWRNLLAVPQQLRSHLGIGNDTRAVIGFGDSFTTPLNQLLAVLDELAPNSPLIGGMASSARSAGENVLMLNGEIFDEGFVGVSLSGPIDVESVVSQGCRPIGRAMVVTKGHENVIEQLGGKPAMTTLREMVEHLATRDRELLQNGLLVGRAISEFRDKFARGDFLVRNIVGVDENKGAIALADFVRTGQTVQFHVRDAATADEDLRLMLEVQKLDDPPVGALLFSCNGRGTRLFDEPCHDIGVSRRAMPSTPVAGFFAAGEIGPVGGKNFIHGHTASFALFRPENRMTATPLDYEPKPPPRRLADDVAYILPMAAFMVFVWIGATWKSLYPIAYVARTAIVAILLVALRRYYTRISWKYWWLGAILGVVGIFQWIGMQLFLQRHFEYFKPSPDVFDPTTAFYGFIVFRIIGAVLVVPVMEELFWRDFAWRTIIAPADFKLARIGEWDLKAFVVVPLIFATVHGNWWATAIVWGFMIGGLLVYTKSLGACIVMHAVTNLLLACYVLWTKDWSFW